MTVNSIHLIYAPAVPGLVFRQVRLDDDLPGMVEAINASKAADGVDEVETLENLTHSYHNLVNSTLEKDVVIAEGNGRVVGYSRVEWRQLHSGGRVYVNFGYLAPEWRHKGIGRAMLRHNEGRACEIAAGHPADGPRWHQSFAYDSETGKRDLLMSDGYEIARNFYLMQRPNLEDIPDLKLPPGLEVRLVKPEHLRVIWEAANEAFADAWGEEMHTDGDFERYMGSVEYAPDIWKVAWDKQTDEVAGFVLGYIKEADNRAQNRRRGWTENIAVRRPYRRQGVAAALMAENLRELKAHGMTEAALGVDTENVTGALRLYERMGFRPVKTEYLYRKPM